MSKEIVLLPPRHLKPLTRRWWAGVLADYELQPHHIKLLTMAGEAWDRCCAARAVIDQDGMTYVDRFGDPRARPEVKIENDNRISFCRIVRELDLDVAAPPAASRPPLLKSLRRS